jgi:hypothetical protein
MFTKKILTFHSWENKNWKSICLMEIWITWSQTELAKSQFPIVPLEKEIINSRVHLESPVQYFGWQIFKYEWPILATHIWAAVRCRAINRSGLPFEASIAAHIRPLPLSSSSAGQDADQYRYANLLTLWLSWTPLVTTISPTAHACSNI